MYSMVLMAALTTGSAAPECHWSSCHGCSACYGCSGCYGCHGCWGGHGCWGCHGCSGCYGGYSWYSCYGCYGCSACYGCAGCYGCYSAAGCYGCYGGGVYMAPAAAPAANSKSGGGELPMPKKKGSGEEESVRATLTVDLPEGAKLFVDNQAVRSTAAKRRFVTPPLQPGQAYYYDLRAEMVRDGQTVSVMRRVIVRPGQAATAAFPELQANPTATARAGAQ
jgi:uncharacterized protein (TIGR03000 family)